VVKAGDVIKVRVLEVDIARKRIALTRRLEDAPVAVPGAPGRRDSAPSGATPARRPAQPIHDPRSRKDKPAAPANSALAAAFARAKGSS